VTRPEIVLHQFPASHFNEKARWALDWKGLPHRRASYLPGPHAPRIRRLTGQTATPVLELCCAALLAPLASPAHPDMALPEPMPPRVRAFLDRWRDHPGTRWVHERYAGHRGPREPDRAGVASHPGLAS
jgi:hypothetical protein